MSFGAIPTRQNCQMPLKKRWKCAEPAYAERLRAARSQCERRKGEIEDVVAFKPQKAVSDEHSKPSKTWLCGVYFAEICAFATVACMSARQQNTAREACRYVHMEVGHAAQNVHLQGVALDLGTVAIGAFDEAGVKRVAHLSEHEQPLYLLPIGRE